MAVGAGHAERAVLVQVQGLVHPVQDGVGDGAGRVLLRYRVLQVMRSVRRGSPSLGRVTPARRVGLHALETCQGDDVLQPPATQLHAGAQ
jgi:hypothetical protein